MKDFLLKVKSKLILGTLWYLIHICLVPIKVGFFAKDTNNVTLDEWVFANSPEQNLIISIFIFVLLFRKRLFDNKLTFKFWLKWIVIILLSALSIYAFGSNVLH